jgi:hypothetical protein
VQGRQPQIIHQFLADLVQRAAEAIPFQDLQDLVLTDQLLVLTVLVARCAPLCLA